MWHISFVYVLQVCRAQQQQPAPVVGRREALALVPALGLLLAGDANATVNTKSFNGSVSSMSSFNMEGTKKRGVDAKRKQKVIQNLKEKIAAGELQ